jgi:hypothetical protein
MKNVARGRNFARRKIISGREEFFSELMGDNGPRALDPERQVISLAGVYLIV